MLDPYTTRTIKLGVKNLLLHKTRSMLTMLGIIFGVCSVISMLAIGEGTSQMQQESLKKLGSTNIIIESVKPPADENTSGDSNNRMIDYGLTYDDAKRIKQSIPHVTAITQVREIIEETEFAEKKAQVRVIATSPDYFKLKDMRLRSGRFIADLDGQNKDNVIVLSENLARLLFAYRDPLEQTIRVGSHFFKVVGILQSTVKIQKEGDTLAKWDYNVYIPLPTMQARFGDVHVQNSSGSFSMTRIELTNIIVKCASIDHVEAAAKGIQKLLDHFHHKTDFEMKVPLQLIRQQKEDARVYTIVLGCIAAISLLVGGIGIMNIMLASITERTREIGIRRALGARKQDIITQFLVETIVLSAGGGLIGLVLGCLIPSVISALGNIPTAITLWSLIVAFGVSAMTGILFGIYPAKRAADLDPIEALRHE